MTTEMIVNVSPRETRAALLENGVLQELFVERASRMGLTGNLYKGRVSRVLPGMQAAFVDFGLGRDGFLYVREAGGVLEEYGDLFSSEEGEAFSPDATPATAPERFCDPEPDAQASGIPAVLWSTSSTAAPRLSICSGRPSCRQTLRATPSGAITANGR